MPVFIFILDHCLHWLSAEIQLEKIIRPGTVISPPQREPAIPEIINNVLQAVINAGGHIEKKRESADEDSGQLEESKEGEKEADATGSITSADSEESSGAASDDIAMDSTVPLMSEEEEGGDVEVRKEADSVEKELSKRHKLRLLVNKGSVIVVSCTVLLVGVVLAAILHYDYSSCELDELAIDSVSIVLSTAAMHSSSITGTLGPLPTPINV